MAIQLSDATFARIMRVVAQVERARVGEAWMRSGWPNNNQPLLQTVKVTSTTKSGGRFPGVWRYYDATADTWTDMDSVWVEPRNDEELCVRDYLAWRSGDANGRPVFIVDEEVQVIELTSATPSGGYFDAVLKGLTSAGVPDRSGTAIKAYDLRQADELEVGARYLARLSGFSGTTRVYDFRSEAPGGVTTYVDVTINNVDISNVQQGDVVWLYDSMSQTVIGYQWICITGVGCGWVNLCDCTFTATTGDGCCVASLAGSLIVTVDNFSGCSCADSDTGEMYSGDGQSASGQISPLCGAGNRNIQLYLYCNSGGTGANDWRLAWNITDAEEPACVASGVESPVVDMGYEASCSPFSLYFDLTFPAECCNTTGADVTIRIHITEA